MDQVLTPTYINFSFGNKAINIVDAQLSLNYDNGSYYTECMSAVGGKKTYMLVKGNTVAQEGDIFTTITKTGDKQQDESISYLQQEIVAAGKTEDPKDYVKDAVITIQDSEMRQFLTFSFTGFIKNLKMENPKQGNQFTNYKAEFEISDPLSISLTN